jgi:hypothetical protein
MHLRYQMGLVRVQGRNEFLCHFKAAQKSGIWFLSANLDLTPHDLKDINLVAVYRCVCALFGYKLDSWLRTCSYPVTSLVYVYEGYIVLCLLEGFECYLDRVELIYAGYSTSRKDTTYIIFQF